MNINTDLDAGDYADAFVGVLRDFVSSGVGPTIIVMALVMLTLAVVAINFPKEESDG